MDNIKPKILLAEGDRDLAFAIELALKGFGYDVKYTYDGVLAITAFTEEKFDLLILGGDVSRINATEVAEIFSAKCGAPILCLIKNRLRTHDPYKENFGYATFLTLPFNAEDLKKEVERALSSKDFEAVLAAGPKISFKEAKHILGDKKQSVTLTEANVLEGVAKGVPPKCECSSMELFLVIDAINNKLALLGARSYIKKTTKGYEIAHD